MKRKNLHVEETRMLPRAAAGCSPSSAAAPRGGGGHRKRVMDELKARGDAPHAKLFTTKKTRSGSGWCANSASAPPPTSPGARTPGRVGRHSAVPPEQAATICATCAAVPPIWLRGRPLRPFRAGLHPLPDQLRPPRQGRHRDLAPLPRRCRRSGRELWRLALGRTRRRPGARELLPKMFGPELVQAFREFKAIWDPHNR